MRGAVTDKRKIGDLRPSQLLYTFGVGAMVELPNLSVMVMGLDDWPVDQGSCVITEPRLLKAVQREIGQQVARLLTPPITPDATGWQASPFEDSANVGVPVAPFPRWLLCSYCRLLAPIQSDLFELKLDPYRKDRSRYVHRNCSKPGKAPSVVPARFLVACEEGHLDDFPWVRFAHRGETDCAYQLRLDELGASGEVADIQVKCVRCKKPPRRMSDAFSEIGKIELSQCRGRLPHLRKFKDELCRGQQRSILLGASNSWFPVMLSALSIPSTSDKLEQLIELNWGELEECESAREVKLKRKLLRGLAGYAEEQIWEAAEKRKSGDGKKEDEVTDLRSPEWSVFSNPDPNLNTRDFTLRIVKPPAGYEQLFEKVVLAERLREVRSLIGFTRIESPGDYSEMAELPPERRVSLSRAAPRWVPASEIRGEGIFLQFKEESIEGWIDNAKRLGSEFFEAHRQWRSNRGLEPEDGFPGMRYVLLHSLAHALIRQFSLECGYTTASIRERIYSRAPGGDEEPMAGILLYTAAPDSEGTLGGLVSLGEPSKLGRHLDQALDGIGYCASDPLCAEHHPYRDGLTLHGSACHACLFLPETSCERGNKYLDRSVLVSTVERADVAFFSGFADPLPEASLIAKTDEHASPPPEPKPVTPEHVEVVESCDARCREFAEEWISQGLPLPIVGYELQDETSRVAIAEFAWPEREIAALLPERIDGKPVFESKGWQVLDATQLKEQEALLKELLAS